MQQNEKSNVTKVKSKNVKNSAIRVSQSTQKKVTQLLTKANKKTHGRKVKADQLVALALSLINDSHLRDLQQQSLNNADRLEIKYREYIKKNGHLSKDEFLGQLLMKMSPSTIENSHQNIA